MLFISLLNPYDSMDTFSRNPETPLRNLQYAVQGSSQSANGTVNISDYSFFKSDINSSINQLTERTNDRMGNWLHHQSFA